MDFWYWFILIIGSFFIILLLYALYILQRPKHKSYILVRRLIPNVILVIIIFYALSTLIRFTDYMKSADIHLKELVTHGTTYTTIVNFIALLTFYQFLVDRVKKLLLKNEVDNSIDITTRELKVVTYSKYEKIVERNERKVYSSYKKE